MAFGNGVEREFIFPVVLENYLHQHAVSNAEVVNMGVSAHGPSLEYLYFLEEGRKYRPRIVVIAVCLANDVVDEVNYQAFKLENGKLIFQPYRIPLMKRLTDLPPYQFLINHSQLLVLVRNQLAPKNRKLRKAFSERKNFSPNINFALKVWEEFAKAVTEEGAVPVFLLLPTREQMLLAKGREVEEDPYPIARPTREALLERCEEKSFHCLDMLPVMTKAFDNPDDAFVRDVFTGHIDFHYNRLGHRVVGKELGGKLMEWKLVETSS